MTSGEAGETAMALIGELSPVGPQILSQNGSGRLDGLVRETEIPRVSVVSSGHADGRVSELLDSDALRRIIAEARSRADVVLVDTAPILTGDPASLLRAVDGVLVVARAGKTSIDVAERAGELLRRLGAPVVGVALNGSRETVLPKIYYRADNSEMGVPSSRTL